MRKFLREIVIPTISYVLYIIWVLCIGLLRAAGAVILFTLLMIFAILCIAKDCFSSVKDCLSFEKDIGKPNKKLEDINNEYE